MGDAARYHGDFDPAGVRAAAPVEEDFEAWEEL